MLRVLFFLFSWENTKEEGCWWQPHHRETCWPAAFSTLSQPSGPPRDHVFWVHAVWLSCQRTRLDLESQSHEHETTCSGFHPAPLLTLPPQFPQPHHSPASGSRDVTPSRVIKAQRQSLGVSSVFFLNFIFVCLIYRIFMILCMLQATATGSSYTGL